jgi:hypothetical protein
LLRDGILKGDITPMKSKMNSQTSMEFHPKKTLEYFKQAGFIIVKDLELKEIFSSSLIAKKSVK